MEQKEGINLEQLVAQPTWREMLFDLVVSEKLDPWNIDLVDITSKYLERVRKLQKLDLRVPANLILAASILLRFKSDALRFEEEEQVVEQQTFIDETQAPVEIPMLSLRTRIPRKRKVTLNELMTALEEVFEEQKRRQEKPVIRENMVIDIPKYNITRQMNEVFARVKKTADASGLATFSSLLKERSRKEIIYTLIPLLHLAQDGKLSVFQEKFFGEIFIQLPVMNMQKELQNSKLRLENTAFKEEGKTKLQ
ncbi:MAG: ScpA family protein [Candidatus Micrarchaeota archaeon]|nr:ScpA family protein [Candidatus Micrarchaeota archaeon]